MDSPRGPVPAPVAAEVVELGQTLFDVVIDAAAQADAGADDNATFPEEDVRAAADEFFRALRLLLGLDRG